MDAAGREEPKAAEYDRFPEEDEGSAELDSPPADVDGAESVGAAASVPSPEDEASEAETVEGRPAAKQAPPPPAAVASVLVVDNSPRPSNTHATHRLWAPCG